VHIDLKVTFFGVVNGECRLCEVRLVFFFVSPGHVYFLTGKTYFKVFFNNVRARLQTLRGSDVI